MRDESVNKQIQMQKRYQTAEANTAGEYQLKTANEEARLSDRHKPDMSPPERLKQNEITHMTILCLTLTFHVCRITSIQGPEHDLFFESSPKCA